MKPNIKSMKNINEIWRSVKISGNVMKMKSASMKKYYESEGVINGGNGEICQ